MANDYFNHVNNRIAIGTRALESQINNIADEVVLGFDKMADDRPTVEGRTRYDVDTGVADAYVVTLDQTPTYTDGFNLVFTAVNASTGATTIDVNGLGTKPIINTDGTPMVAGSIPAGAKVNIVYDSGTDSFMLLSMNATWNGPSVAILDEAVQLTARLESINIVGAGVVVTEPTPNNILITIA